MSCVSTVGALTIRQGWLDMDSMNLTGKTAVVTGGSRGIGHATARYLSQLGANVVLTARTQDAADAAA
jgi:short-subunit dehydrogenase